MSQTASYRYTLLLLLLLAVSSVATAQRVSIQTRLDRSEIRIGEQAAVEMTIRTDDLARTRYHLVEDSTGVERFQVLAFAATDTVDLGDGLKEIQAKMIITSFDSTLITIPPILVETPSGQALSKPLALNVISPEVDLAHPERFEPIMSPWEERISLEELLELLKKLWPVYPLAALIVLAILWWRHRRRQPALPSVPITSPIVKTLLERFQERLAGLGSYPLASQEDFKAYYTELTDALRHYFGQLYHIDTMEKTSEELLSSVELQGCPRADLQLLHQILQGADYVKFAKSLPAPSDASAHTQLALQLAQHEYQRLHPAPAETLAERKEVVQ